jgi:pyruvate kinase
LNFSHAGDDYERERTVLDCVQGQGDGGGSLAAVLGDLQGPKVRVGEIPDPGLELVEGEEIVMRTQAGADEIPLHEEVGSALLRSVQALIAGSKDAKPEIIFGDGELVIEMTEVLKDGVRGRVTAGGRLTSRKGITIRGIDIDMDPFPAKDQNDLRFCLDHGVNFIGVSFVRNAGDINRIRNFISEHLGPDQPHPSIVAKIETLTALENIEEILEVTDGIMVARGDLGLQIGVEAVPLEQKRLIRAARGHGRAVIVATQMLESMVSNPSPTRAEATDVFNAIIDGGDAIMLSGETSVGTRPIEAVETMDRIARQAEQFRADPEWLKRERKATRRRMRELAGNKKVGRINEEMALTAVQFAEHIPARAVVSFTRTGGTLRRMSRYRPGVPLIGVCKNAQVARGLLIYYGVHPIVMHRNEDDPSITKLVKASRPFLRKYFELTPGDALVVTCGIDWARGGTNAIRVVVDDIDAFDGS